MSRRSDRAMAASSSQAAASGSQAAPAASERQLPFSTTGRDPGKDADDQSRASGIRAVVKLCRTSQPEAASLPEKLLLGGPGLPDSSVLGRDECCDLVLNFKFVSKVQCQFALRGFRLPNTERCHEAVFIRDSSKNGTLVNGAKAFRPWHWLQDGDVIGLRRDGQDPAPSFDFFQVKYLTHTPLPGEFVELEEDGGVVPIAEPPAAAAPGPTAASSDAAARGRGTSLGRGRSHKRKQEPAFEKESFREDIIGRIVDITYQDGKTFRMRVIRYMPKEDFHECDSEGLSDWDGDSFTDVHDLNTLLAIKWAKFVDEAGGGAANGLRKKARKH